VVEQIIVDGAVLRLLALVDAGKVAVRDADVRRREGRPAGRGRQRPVTLGDGPEDDEQEEDAAERQIRKLAGQRDDPSTAKRKPGRRCLAGPGYASILRRVDAKPRLPDVVALLRRQIQGARRHV
jgi:hypothetical protein